ncbi:MAG TPA: hypothetical protein VII75_09325 [Thermoanaerobaculia bacterium]|nr:hypothetical protein [Thermoanaerobaculia bacterium]
MTTKLRSIRTVSRAATVKRSDVASAAKEVKVSRDADAGRFVDVKSNRKITATRSK